MDSAKIGALIAQLRKAKGLNQSELAALLSISNRTVSKWENGDGLPDITIIPDLARVLDISTDELLNGEVNPVSTAEEKVDFVIEYTESKANYRQSVKNATARKCPQSLLISAFVFIEIFLMTISHLLIRNQALKSVYGFVIYILFLVFLIVILGNILYPCKKLRAIRLYNGGVIPQTRLTVGDTVTLERGSEHIRYNKNEMTELLIADSQYLLVFNNKVSICVPRSALGSEQTAFEAYMKSTAKSFKVIRRETKHRVVTAILIIAAVVTALLNMTGGYANNSKYFYDDIPKKTEMFYNNRYEVEECINEIKSDGALYDKLADDNGSIIYDSADMELPDIASGAYATFSAFGIIPNGPSAYDAGYAYCKTADEVPAISMLTWYTPDVVYDKEDYREADGVYLYGKDVNGAITDEDWYIIVPLGDGWYYFEYHSV